MRVLSLLPSATEIVAALGAVEQLVGISHACDFPGALSGLPVVTRSDVDASAPPALIDADVRRIIAEGRSLYAVDEPLVRALQPDLIFTQALCDVCAVSEADVRSLAARLTPAPRVVSLSASTLDGVFADIASVGHSLDAADESTELLAGLRARLRSVHDTLKRARAPRPPVAVIEWSDPLFAAGHWVPEMVRRAGGVDVLALAGAHSLTITLEQLTRAEPQHVLFAPCGYGLKAAADEARAMMSRLDWAPLLGAEAWALDANALTSRPGPRLVDGVETLARIFHAQLFTPLLPGRATAILAG